MTQQESFKRRVRARMEKTGERYTAARRVLLEQAPNRRRTWVAEPEMGDEAVAAATGKGWDDWCDVIDRWSGRAGGHAAIATHLVDEHGVDPWWAQGITVGYERIAGLRLPFQKADGTFTATKSQTVAVEADVLRALLLDDEQRSEVFPGLITEVRSRSTSKAIRLAIGPGVALISLDSTSPARTKIVIAHEKLPDFDHVEEWKFYWTEWLDAIDG